MSTASNTGSPASVQELHHPDQAQVIAPQQSAPQPIATAPMGSGANALLAKKFASAGHFYSPTDTMVSPCTAKLQGTKQRHFAKGKPLSLANSFAAAGNKVEPPSQAEGKSSLSQHTRFDSENTDVPSGPTDADMSF